MADIPQEFNALYLKDWCLLNPARAGLNKTSFFVPDIVKNNKNQKNNLFPGEGHVSAKLPFYIQ